MKPFSTWRADVPKRSLTINLPNEAPPKRRIVGACHAERRRHQRRSPNKASSLPRRPRMKCCWQSIAGGGRTAMHILYSRHNVRVYRFVLRIVRDTTMAEDLVSQVFLDVWRTASAVRRPFPGFHLAAVDRPLQGADRDAPAPARRTSTRRTCLKSPTRPTRPSLAGPQQHQRHPARLRRQAVAGASRDHQPGLLPWKSVEEAGAIIGIPRAR